MEMHNSGKMHNKSGPENRSGTDLSESHCYASKTDRAWKVDIGNRTQIPMLCIFPVEVISKRIPVEDESIAQKSPKIEEEEQTSDYRDI